MTWFALRLLAAECLAFVLGLMFLPRPQVLVVVLYFAAGVLIADELRKRPRHKRIARWLRRRWPNWRVPWNHWLAPWVAALIVVTTLLPAWPFIERALWDSGNFGEPPYNRYVVV